MTGYLILCAFLLCGVMIADALFYSKSMLLRIWLGLCAGLMLMMWTPVPFAYAMSFNRAAQLCGLGLSAALAVAAALTKRMKGLRGKKEGFFGDVPPAMFLALLIPFVLISGVLQYTHTLREVAGGMNVGQSTFGDLCLHLGIATGMRNAPFPPEYTILPGTLIGYPFLADSMVTTMILFGSDLAASFIVTGTLMMVLVYAGFILFAWELTHKKAAVVLAFLLMFLNGGLGFLYTFDGVFKDSTALRNVFTGFYATPTNMPELNLRWVNVICDMMIPQRTLLTGWMVLLPALYMLIEALRSEKRSRYIILGVWAGLMPMVHTHSFFALGLASTGVLVCSLIHAKKGELKETALRFGLYALFAALLAAPQLLTWTFPQTLGGESSLSIRLNWVNNQGNGQLIDGYFWFWIKNVGLVYIFMLPAALSAKRGSVMRMLAIGAAVIYTVAEIVQFQPNPYDNNKLFYVAFMLMLPAVAQYLVALYEKLRGLRGRALLATLFLGVCFISGSLSLARELISDYQLFYAEEIEAARFIEENLEPDAVFLTGDQHNNVVAALAGRKIVCGTDSYLYFHGVDYSAQREAERLMLKEPGENLDLFEEYGVDYVYISSRERMGFEADEDWFCANFDTVFQNSDVTILRVGQVSE